MGKDWENRWKSLVYLSHIYFSLNWNLLTSSIFRFWLVSVLWYVDTIKAGYPFLFPLIHVSVMNHVGIYVIVLILLKHNLDTVLISDLACSTSSSYMGQYVFNTTPLYGGSVVVRHFQFPKFPERCLEVNCNQLRDKNTHAYLCVDTLTCMCID